MELIKKQGSGVRGQGSGCDHGGNVYKASRELGIPESRIIDFSASINPLGISETVKAAILAHMEGLVHYPDPDADAFRRTVSGLHGISPGTVLPGNGSTELIYLLPRALRPRTALIPSPTFSEYEKACRLAGSARIKRYALKKENTFQIEPDAFIEEMEGCDMAFLCNPNNPTGHTLARDDVLRIAAAADSLQCVLIIDEAFIDFVPGCSVTEDVKGYSHVVVLRSLTKFYALTGLRIGYAVSSEELCERMNKAKEPWSVNNLAQAAAIAALGDTEYADQTRAVLAMEKEYLENSFQALGVQWLPSSVNYYLLRLQNAARLVSGARAKGILVRSGSNFRGLDNSYVRVAVRTHEHNAILMEELARL